MMRVEYIAKRELEHILACMMPENRLAMEVSLATGLRISDVLGIRSEQLKENRTLTVKETKTQKTRRVRLSVELYGRCKGLAGKKYVWEARSRTDRPRARQTVYKDLRRVADLMRLKEHIGPHSARKVYAVEAYRRTGGNLKRVQELLNHEYEATTILYALSDALTRRTMGYKG